MRNKNQPLHACKVGRSPLNTMKPACALAKGTRTGDWNVSFLVGRHSLIGYTMTKMMDVPFQERLRDPSQTDALGYFGIHVPGEFRELLWEGTNACPSCHVSLDVDWSIFISVLLYCS